MRLLIVFTPIKRAPKIQYTKNKFVLEKAMADKSPKWKVTIVIKTFKHKFITIVLEWLHVH